MCSCFNFSGSCKSSLASRFVLQMYLIKYIKEITRKPEVAETHQTIFPALFILGIVMSWSIITLN